jgi:hypothetical protein
MHAEICENCRKKGHGPGGPIVCLKASKEDSRWKKFFVVVNNIDI